MALKAKKEKLERLFQKMTEYLNIALPTLAGGTRLLTVVDIERFIDIASQCFLGLYEFY
jgi:hypothetical protein